MGGGSGYPNHIKKKNQPELPFYESHIPPRFLFFVTMPEIPRHVNVPFYNVAFCNDVFLFVYFRCLETKEF